MNGWKKIVNSAKLKLGSENGGEKKKKPSIHDAARREMVEKKEKRQPVETIVKFLRKDIKKLQTYSRLPLFLVFVVLLNLNLALVAVNLNDAGHYYRNSGSRTDLADDIFLNIHTLSDFWSWMQNNATNIWDQKALSNPNRPLGFMVLRQFRVVHDSGIPVEQKLLPLHVQKFMRKQSLPAYESSWLSNLPYSPSPSNPIVEAVLSQGRRPPWEANNNLSPGMRRNVDGISIQGRLAMYNEPGYAYTMYLDLNLTSTEAKDQIGALQTLKWVDDASRVVFVEILSFNDAQRSFLLTSFMMELSTTGIVLPSVRNFPCVIHNFWEPKFYLVAILDVLIMLYTLYEIVDTFLYLTKYTSNKEGMANVLGAWNLVQVLQIILFIMCYVSRVRMWVHGIQLGKSNYYTANSGDFGGGAEGDKRLLFETLAKYAELYELSYTRIAVGNLVAWVRIIGFLRYSDKFGVLSETITNSTSLLLGWVMTFFLIFVPYAIAGHILFGSTLKDFRSFTSTVAFLLFMIARGQIDNYNSMDIMFPVWTPIFFVSFLALAWLVMLNLFIAIVTGTFEVVQGASPPNGSFSKWHPKVLWASVVAYASSKYRDLKNIRRRTPNRKLRNKNSKPEEEKLSVSEENQYEAIDRLKELGCREEGDYDITGIDLNRKECYIAVKGVIPMSEVNKVFARCEYEETANSTWKKVSERWTYQTDKKTEYVKHQVIPKIKELEMDLERAGELDVSLQGAKQTYSEVVPKLVELSELNEILKQVLSLPIQQLPFVEKSSEVAEHIALRQKSIDETGDIAQGLIDATTELCDMFTTLQSKMNKTADVLTKKTRKTIWGMNEREYDDLAPIVIESRPGMGRVAKVEKLGRAVRLHDGNVPLPEDGYTNWLSSKVGGETLLKRRMASVQSEIDEKL